MNGTVLLAVIFPANLPYFSAFLNSIANQTDVRFDILIANDGVDQPLSGLEGFSNVAVIPVSGSPIQTRIRLMEEAAKRGYQKFIFADTDDELSKNRIAVVKKLLDGFSCVCNDVDLITAEGQLIADHYWRERIMNEQVIDTAFLVDKNIIGFGNVGLTAEAFMSMQDFKPTDVPAPDWLYFYVLTGKSPAIFTNQCTTRYRQHGNNSIGIKAMDKTRLLKIIEAKKKQYNALDDLGYDMGRYPDKNLRLQRHLQSGTENMQEAINTLSTLNINYFWWEETNYLV